MNDYKKYRGRGRGAYVHSNNYRNPNGFNSDMGRNNRYQAPMPMHMNTNFRETKARWPRLQHTNYHWRGPPPILPFPRPPAPFMRRPLLSPPRHPTPRMPLLPQPPRALSPLPGSEEARQKAIAEASARIKEQLEMEEGCPNSMCPPPPVPHLLFMQPVNPINTQQQQQKIAKRKTRRSTSTVDNSTDVEQLRQKILTQFTHMSKGKIQNLVNNPGSSRYDAALQHLVRDMRLHLSSELRDMYNKHDVTKESNEMIDHFNSIVPDLGVELVSLPHTMVEELSKILQLDMNNETPVPAPLEIVEPENMFKQAEMMLSDVSYLEPPLESAEIDNNYGNEQNADDPYDSMLNESANFQQMYAPSPFNNQHFAAAESIINNFADDIDCGLDFSIPDVSLNQISDPETRNIVDYPIEDMSMSPVSQTQSPKMIDEQQYPLLAPELIDNALQEIALPSGQQEPCLNPAVDYPLQEIALPPNFEEAPEVENELRLETIEHPLQANALPPKDPLQQIALPLELQDTPKHDFPLQDINLPVVTHAHNVNLATPIEIQCPINNGAELPITKQCVVDKEVPAEIENINRSVSPLSRRLQEQNCLNPQRPLSHEELIYEETISNPSNPNITQSDANDPKSISFKSFWLPKHNPKVNPNDNPLLTTPDHSQSPTITSSEPNKTNTTTTNKYEPNVLEETVTTDSNSNDRATSTITNPDAESVADPELRNFRNRSRSKSPDRRPVHRPSLDDRIKQLMKIKEPLSKLDESQLNKRQIKQLHKLRQIERDRLTAKIVFDPKYTKSKSKVGVRGLKKSETLVRDSRKKDKPPLLKIKFNEPKLQKIVVTAAQLQNDEPELTSPDVVVIKQELIDEPEPSEQLPASKKMEIRIDKPVQSETKRLEKINRIQTPVPKTSVETEEKRQEQIIRAVPQSTKEDSILQKPGTSTNKLDEITSTKKNEEGLPPRSTNQSKETVTNKIKLKRSDYTPPLSNNKPLETLPQKQEAATLNAQKLPKTIIAPTPKTVAPKPFVQPTIAATNKQKSEQPIDKQSHIKTAQEQIGDDLRSIDQICEDIQNSSNEITDTSDIICIIGEIDVEDKTENVIRIPEEQAEDIVEIKEEVVYNDQSTLINSQHIDCAARETYTPPLNLLNKETTQKEQIIKLKRHPKQTDKPVEVIVNTKANTSKENLNEIDKLFNKIIRNTIEVDKSKDKTIIDKPADKEMEEILITPLETSNTDDKHTKELPKLNEPDDIVTKTIQVSVENNKQKLKLKRDENIIDSLVKQKEHDTKTKKTKSQDDLSDERSAKQNNELLKISENPEVQFINTSEGEATKETEQTKLKELEKEECNKNEAKKTHQSVNKINEVLEKKHKEAEKPRVEDLKYKHNEEKRKHNVDKSKHHEEKGIKQHEELNKKSKHEEESTKIVEILNIEESETLNDDSVKESQGKSLGNLNKVKAVEKSRSSNSSHRGSSKTSSEKRSDSRTSKSNREHSKSSHKSSRSASEPRINKLANLSSHNTILDRMMKIDAEIQSLMHEKWNLYKELQAVPSSSIVTTTTNTTNPRKRTMVSKETNTDESHVRKQARIQTDPLVSKGTNTDASLNRKQVKLQTDPLISKESNTQVSPPTNRKQAKTQTEALVSKGTNTDVSPIRKQVKLQTNLYISTATNTVTPPVYKQAIIQTDPIDTPVEQPPFVIATQTYDDLVLLKERQQSETPSEISEQSLKRPFSVTPSDSSNIAHNETDSGPDKILEDLTKHKRKRKKQTGKGRKRQKIQQQTEETTTTTDNKLVANIHKNQIGESTSDSESLARMQTRKSEKLSLTIEQVVNPPFIELCNVAEMPDKPKRNRASNDNIRKTRSLYKETESIDHDPHSVFVEETEKHVKTKQRKSKQTDELGRDRSASTEKSIRKTEKIKMETEEELFGERLKSCEVSVESNRSRNKTTETPKVNRERSESKDRDIYKPKPKSRRDKVKLDGDSTNQSTRSKNKRKSAKCDTSSTHSDAPKTGNTLSVKPPKPKIKIKLGKPMSDDDDPLIGFNSSDIETQSRIEIENIISKSEKELFKSKKCHVKIDELDMEIRRKRHNKSNDSIDKPTSVETTKLELDKRIEISELIQTDEPLMSRIQTTESNEKESVIDDSNPSIAELSSTIIESNTLVPKVEILEVPESLLNTVITLNPNANVATQFKTSCDTFQISNCDIDSATLIKTKEPTKPSTARRKKCIKPKRTTSEDALTKPTDPVLLPITPCFVSLERVSFAEKSKEEHVTTEQLEEDTNQTIEQIHEEVPVAIFDENPTEDTKGVEDQNINKDQVKASEEVIILIENELTDEETIEIKIEPIEPVLELDLTKPDVSDEIDEEGIFCMGHQKSILDIKVVGDEFLAASEDGTIYKYCMKTGSLQDAYTGHTRAVTCMHVTNGQILNIPSTLLYSGSLDYTLKCYNIDTAEVLHDVSLEQAIQCMDAAWGHIFLGTYEGLLFIYNIQKKLLNDLSLTIASSTVLMIKATQEGSRQVLILASRKREIMVRDAFTGLLLRTMCQDYRPTIYSLFLDRSMVYCGTSDKGILILDFNNGSQIGTFTAGKGVVCMLMHRGLLFAGCYDGMIYVYNSKTQSHVATVSGPGDGMMLSLAIHGNQIIAGTKKDHLLKIWRIPQEILKQCD